MTTVFVSHPPDKLAHYFGDCAIAALKAVLESLALAPLLQ